MTGEDGGAARGVVRVRALGRPFVGVEIDRSGWDRQARGEIRRGSECRYSGFVSTELLSPSLSAGRRVSS